MKTYTIEYQMKFTHQQQVSYSLEFDEQTAQLKNNTPATLPGWTKLEFKQCAH